MSNTLENAPNSLKAGLPEVSRLYEKGKHYYAALGYFKMVLEPATGSTEAQIALAKEKIQETEGKILRVNEAIRDKIQELLGSVISQLQPSTPRDTLQETLDAISEILLLQDDVIRSLKQHVDVTDERVGTLHRASSPHQIVNNIYCGGHGQPTSNQSSQSPSRGSGTTPETVSRASGGSINITLDDQLKKQIAGTIDSIKQNITLKLKELCIPNENHLPLLRALDLELAPLQALAQSAT